MPQAFDKCVKEGGKVITKTPESGKYLHICFPVGGGPSVAGEVKSTKSPKRAMPPNKKK